jgi:alcohol dehydrogenase class IV
MANMACGNAGLGLMHAMTNPMEGMFKIPHGLAVGTLLPYVMEFNLPAAHQRFAMLAKAMGENGSQRLLTDMASKAVTAIKNLFIELGFPRKYSDSLIDPTAIPKMAKIMMGGLYGQYDPSKEYAMNAAIPSVNVRKATLKDAIELYKKAFEGWD